LAMRGATVRTKLTLTTVLVLAVLYTALGVVVQVSARQAIMSSVNSELLQMSAGMRRGMRNRPPPPPRPGVGPEDHHEFDRPEFHGPPPPQDPLEMRPRAVWDAPNNPRPMQKTAPLNPEAVIHAERGKETLATVTYKGIPVRVLTFPMVGADGTIESVTEIPYRLDDIDKTLDSLRRTLLLILPVGLLLMAAASIFVVGRATRPIKQITEETAGFEASDLSGRLRVVGSDEFATLASTINGMLGRLQEAFEQQHEIIVQQRRFTADASHELKTPLAVIKANTGLLKPGLAKGSNELESVTAIDEAASRMARLVQDLLLLARTDAGQLSEQFKPVDLVSSLGHSLSLAPCPGKVGFQNMDGNPHVCGSGFALERLVTNLVDNACRHTAPDGHVWVRLLEKGPKVGIQVEDDGVGIPEEHLEKLFDRFYRVDEGRDSSSGGTGLGLAICKGIVEAHGGTIEVASQLGKGTTFTVWLPRA